MQFRLRAGELIDVLTRPELDDAFRQHEARTRAWQHEQEREVRWLRIPASGMTDANGNATLEVYRVGQGQEIRVQRIVVTADGYDAGTPHSGGGIQLLRDGVIVDVGTGGELPGTIVSPDGAGARFRNGALLEVEILKGPASSGVHVEVEASQHAGGA